MQDYDAEYCDGVIEREVPVIADIVRTMEIGSTSSDQFCITFLGVCKAPAVDKWKVSFPSKKPCDTTRATPSGKDPIHVIHYSDIHIDPLYEEGASTKCDKPTCCRAETNATSSAAKTEFPAGPNGDHNCDVPATLEESMYKAIKDMFPDAAFALFTGDLVDHGMHNTSQEYNEGESKSPLLFDTINVHITHQLPVESAYGMMDKYLGLVYGTAGNHEADPANIFEPNSLGNSTHWVYDALTDEWSRWIGKEAAKNAQTVGAYSVKYPKGNLRIISLNTNLYYRFNFIMYQKEMEKDPNGQIAWLVEELDAAEKAGENVYIMGHMPLGEKDALPNASNYLDQVVNRYAGTIKAMFFGHTHVDHFEVSYANYAKRSHAGASAISYIAPSLTPTSGMPSFRVYTVDPETFAVLDATTYISDMSDSSFQTKGPVWKKYYSAKEAYGPLVDPPLKDAKAELTPAFWHNVTAALEDSEDEFDAYMSRKSRGWKADDKCRGDCMAEEICQLRAGRSQDNCYEPSPGVHFSKRSEAGIHDHGEHDSCGVSVSAKIFSALAQREDLLEIVQKRLVDEGVALQPVNVKRAESTETKDDDEDEEEEECEPSPTTGSKPSSTGADANATDTGAAGALEPMGAMAILALGALVL